MFRELVFVICVFTRNPFQPDSITKNVIIRYISICMFYKILHKPRTWLCEFTKAVFPLLQVTWRKCFVRPPLFVGFYFSFLFIHPFRVPLGSVRLFLRPYVLRFLFSLVITWPGRCEINYDFIVNWIFIA